MKKIIFALTVLISCSTTNLALTDTQSDCYKGLAQKTYETILHMARKDNPDFLAIDKADLIEQQIIILGSLNGDPQAFRLLVALLDIYIGESTGEILSQIIVEKGEKIIPHLEKALNAKSTCNRKLYTCLYGAKIERLIQAINKGETYGAGEPLPYLNKDDLKKKCK